MLPTKKLFGFNPKEHSVRTEILLGHLTYVTINLASGHRENLTPGMYVLALIFLLKFILQ